MPSGIYTHKLCRKETKIKLSESKKQLYLNGYTNNRKGVIVSKETLEKMSLCKIGKNHPMYGKHWSQEHNNKISLSQKGKKKKVMSEQGKTNISEGQLKRYLRDGYSVGKLSKKGVREDLKEYGYIPCSNEANYIRYLKYINEPFEYQIPILLSNNRWYICDFYLTNKKQFIELKGYKEQIRPKTKEKYNLLKLGYPTMNWRILFQNSAEWKNIINQYSKLIPNWEFYKRSK